MPDKRLFNLFLPGTVCLPSFPDRGSITLEKSATMVVAGTNMGLPQLEVVQYIEPATTVVWRIRFESVSAIFLPQCDSATWDQDEWIFLPAQMEWHMRSALLDNLEERLKCAQGFVFVREDAPVVTNIEKGSTAAEAHWPRGCDCEDRDFSFKTIVRG